MVHVTVAYMISDTLQTLVSVPFYALTPEITSDYDERTSLTGFRMFCNLLASLATAVSAPLIIDAALAAGFTQRQGYLTVAALFGGLAALPFALMALVVRERFEHQALNPSNLRTVAHTAWHNVPFRFATGIYALNWITFDVNILHKYLQGLDGSAEPSTGVPVRVGDLPTI